MNRLRTAFYFARNKKMLFVIWCIFIFGALYTTPGNAASGVTYTCCKSYAESEGVLIDGINDSSKWAIGGTATGKVLVNDTVYYREFGQSVKLSGVGGSVSAQRTGLNFDLSQANSFNIWVYLYNFSNITNINVYFGNDDAFTARRVITVTRSTHMINGWNRISFLPEETVDESSGGTFANPVTAVKVRITSPAGKEGNVSFSSLRYNYSARPKAMFAFDDGNDSVYDSAFPIMQSNNQRGVVAVIMDDIDQGYAYYMNLTQLDGLYNSGWDVASHTWTHSDLSASVNLTLEVNDSQDWLVNHGYNRSKDFFVYPMGRYNNTVLDRVKQRYVLGRSTINGSYLSGIVAPSNGDNTSYLIPVVNMGNQTPEQQAFDSINTTIKRNGTVILLFHVLTENDLSSNIFYKISGFQNISNYLKSREQDIDVVTFYDYVNINIPDGTPIFNKTVNIAADGSASIVVNNYGNDNTVNMTVFPSMGSVNVTVLAWNTSGNHYKRWNESSLTSDVVTSHTVGDNPPDVWMDVRKNGSVIGSYRSNSSGYISFDYSGGYSEVQFEMDLSAPNTSSVLSSYSNISDTILATAGLMGDIFILVINVVPVIATTTVVIFITGLIGGTFAAIIALIKK